MWSTRIRLMIEICTGVSKYAKDINYQGFFLQKVMDLNIDQSLQVKKTKFKI